MNPAVFAASYVLLRVTHGIADYWLQPGSWAEAKSKNSVALAKHIVVYSLCFVPTLLLIRHEWVHNLSAVQLLSVLLAIALPHALSDTYVPIVLWLEKLRGWSRDKWSPVELEALSKTANFIRLHVLLAFDQEFHKACLAAAAAYLSWG